MSEPQLTEIAPGVHELRLPIPFEDGSINTFLFSDGTNVDMVDCGMNSADSLDQIRRALRRLGGRLRRLVVTHIHADHFGAAGLLREEMGAELYLHRLEIPLVHPRYVELETLVEEVGRHLRLHGCPAAETQELKNASRAIREFVTPGEADVQLDGAETIELGGRQLRVLWTPGHSPGHICLHDAHDGLLFAGDQLLPDVSPNIGLHPQSTPDPLDDYVRGLRMIIGLDVHTVLPAHGRPFHEPRSRCERLIGHHERRKDRLERLIGDRELNAWDIALEMWGRRRDIWDQRLALQEGLAHLQSMAVEGRVEKLVSPTSVRWRLPRPA